MRLYTETKEFVKEDGGILYYEQVMLDVDGFVIPIKTVFKSDRRLLLALVDRKES